MATLEQMIENAIEITTRAGVKYKLPRLTMRSRRKALSFMNRISEIEASELEMVESMNQILDVMVDFLLFWIGTIDPTITQERIEDDWDVMDIPELMRIVQGMEQEIEAASPPSAPAPKRRNLKQ